MRIAFYSETLHVRGSCTAMYDYAHYNEILLGNESVIIISEDGKSRSDPQAVKKFSSRFPILHFKNKKDVESILHENGCHALYNITYGKNDHFNLKSLKLLVHCVFDMSEPYGDVYAGVSKTLADKFNIKEYVPHMVALKPDPNVGNMRKELGIKDDDIVFGRHGGEHTFDLELAHTAISRAVRCNDKVKIILVNTRVFDYHPSIIHLPMIWSDKDKSRFIQTCDAHLECGKLGQTFGLSIAEFSIHNKPIIAYNGQMWNSAHLEILGDKGIYYDSEESLYDILNTFSPDMYNSRDNNAYLDYSPEKVMEKFREVFLSVV